VARKSKDTKDLNVEMVAVEGLVNHPGNPRQGDIGAIAVSIQENGWFGSLVAQKSTGYVLAGNHRLQAARQLGITEVPVHWLDVNDTQALKILLADNRTNDLATYDNEILTQLLAEIATEDSLLGTGYDGDDLDLLITDGDIDLEELAGQFPEDGTDLWKTVSFRVPPGVHQAWTQWWEDLEGNNDAEKVELFLERGTG